MVLARTSGGSEGGHAEMTRENAAKYFSLIIFVLMTICYIITPLINNAKDTSNDQLWVLLHLATVLITPIVLVLSILTIIYWKSNQ